MAASIAGIWNHSSGLGALQSGSHLQAAAAEGSGGDSGNSDDSGTISANDFLTLLVTEMQNQDPTADTDPNEYINQLVQVNSLEQLISINQTLTADSTTAAGTSPGGTNPDVSRTTPKPPAGDSAAGPVPNLLSGPPVPHAVPGNLTIPPTSAAAQQVARALGGQNNRQ